MNYSFLFLKSVNYLNITVVTAFLFISIRWDCALLALKHSNFMAQNFSPVHFWISGRISVACFSRFQAEFQSQAFPDLRQNLICICFWISGRISVLCISGFQAEFQSCAFPDFRQNLHMFLDFRQIFNHTHFRISVRFSVTRILGRISVSS